jgi:hypothetical protein
VKVCPELYSRVDLAKYEGKDRTLSPSPILLLPQRRAHL